MNILSKEKSKVLAEKNGWSLAQAEGYVDGEACRRRGTKLSAYAQIGIDEYCRGFRASYYERQHVASDARLPGLLVPFQSSGDSVERAESTKVSTRVG
jgi:hypothetical protein